MPQAIVDPSELRRFAISLKKFNAEFQHALTVLHGQLTSLGDTWRDQEHLKFVEEFEETLRVVQSLEPVVAVAERRPGFGVFLVRAPVQFGIGERILAGHFIRTVGQAQR